VVDVVSVIVVVVVVDSTIVVVDVVVDKQFPTRTVFNFIRISSKESPGDISKQDKYSPLYRIHLALWYMAHVGQILAVRIIL
jgi:hypothetical protein